MKPDLGVELNVCRKKEGVLNPERPKITNYHSPRLSPCEKSVHQPQVQQAPSTLWAKCKSH